MTERQQEMLKKLIDESLQTALGTFIPRLDALAARVGALEPPEGDAGDVAAALGNAGDAADSLDQAQGDAAAQASNVQDANPQAGGARSASSSAAAAVAAAGNSGAQQIFASPHEFFFRNEKWRAAFQQLEEFAREAKRNDVAHAHLVLWRQAWAASIASCGADDQVKFLESALQRMAAARPSLSIVAPQAIVALNAVRARSDFVATVPQPLTSFLAFFDAVAFELVGLAFSSPSLVGQAGNEAQKREALLKLHVVHGVNGTRLLLRLPLVWELAKWARANSLFKLPPNLDPSLDAAEALQRVVTCASQSAVSFSRNQSSWAAQPPQPQRQKQQAQRTQSRGKKGGKRQTTASVNAAVLQNDDTNKSDDVSFYSSSSSSSLLPSPPSPPQRPSQRPPPLATLEGAVNGVYTFTLVDMGSQVHLCEASLARSLGVRITATDARIGTANRSSLDVVGVFSAEWSSSSCKYADDPRPTRLALHDVYVVNDKLPAPLLIGLRALWGTRNPRAITYTHDGIGGLFVKFGNFSPLPARRHARDFIRHREDRCSLLRQATDDWLPSPLVMQPLGAPQSFPTPCLTPAVTREQQPLPPTTTAGASFPSAAFERAVQPVLEKHRDILLTPDATPRVAVDLVYAPLLRVGVDFHSLRQVVPRQSPKQVRAGEAEAARLIATGSAVRSNDASPFLAVAHNVEKHDEHGQATGRYRTVGGYHYLNPALYDDAYAMPRSEPILRRAAAADAVTCVDMAKAYEQIAVAKYASALLRTYYAPGCVLDRLTGAFGIKTLPAVLQRRMDVVLGDIANAVASYDDIFIFHASAEPSAVAADIERVLATLSAAGIQLATHKMRVAQRAGIALGYSFDCETHTFAPEHSRLQAWLDTPQPKSKAGLRSWLHVLSHFSQHYPALEKHLAPLRAALQQKYARVNWTDDLTDAFQRARNYVNEHCVFRRGDLHALPPPGTRLILYTDWGRITESAPGGVGWAIETATTPPQLVSCGSKSLPKNDIYNRPARGELYALQCALKRDRHILRDYEVVWRTDCKPLAQAWKKGSSPEPLFDTMLRDLRLQWPSLQVEWIGRSLNPVADLFAAAAAPIKKNFFVVSAIESIIAHDPTHHRYLVRTSTAEHPQWRPAKALKVKAPQLLDEFRLAKRRKHGAIITLPVPPPAQRDPELPEAPRGRGRPRREPEPALADVVNEYESLVERAADDALAQFGAADHASNFSALHALADADEFATSPEDASFVQRLVAAQLAETDFNHLWRAARSPLSDAELEALSPQQRAQIESIRPFVGDNGLLLALPLTSADPPRIVLPSAARPAPFIDAHQRGHFSGAANLAILERHFWWPHMNAQVRKAAQACRTCQEARQGKRVADLGAPRLAGVPMREAFVDTQTSIDGFDLLTIIDVATRFCWVVPFKQGESGSKSRRFGEAFIRVTKMFGKFDVVTADLGKEFQGDFKKILSSHGIRLRTNAPYNPDARGIIERLHGTLLAIIAKLRSEAPRQAPTARFADAAHAANTRARDDCKLH